MQPAPDPELDWISIFVSGAVGAVFSVALAIVAVSLFQAHMDRVVVRLRSRTPRGRTRERTLDGIWLSRYIYESSDAGALELVDEHVLVLRHFRGGIRGHSIPRSDARSALTLSLELEGDTCTGLWREVTAETGRLYHGACQLKLTTTRDALAGIWIGFSRTGPIRSGDWTMKRLENETGWLARRRHKDESGLAWRKERPLGSTPSEYDPTSLSGRR